MIEIRSVTKRYGRRAAKFVSGDGAAALKLSRPFAECVVLLPT